RDLREHARLDDRLRELLGRDEAGVVDGRDELEELGLVEDVELDDGVLDAAPHPHRVLHRTTMVVRGDTPLEDEAIGNPLVQSLNGSHRNPDSTRNWRS